MHRSLLLLTLSLGLLPCACKGCEEPSPSSSQDMSADMSGEPDMADEQDMPLPDEPDLGPPEDAMFGIDARPTNATCAPPARPRGEVDVELVRVLEDVSMTAPIGMYQAPGDPGRWYIVQQDGVIFSVAAEGARDRREVADLSDRVRFYKELGLLGLAFHPDFATNRRAFLHYTYQNDQDRPVTRISEVSADGDGVFNLGGERVIFEVEQPYENHNGGMIAFGPDGMLYIALGDGGSGGDPLGSGQDTDTVLGAILRLDVDRSSGERPYGIPEDNPFADGGGAPEIYAWGLRNPWKFSFDLRTGELWAGDVGQREVEEVDLIERGGNYGWNIREGDQCYDGNPQCDRGDLIEPVVVYGHDEGKSITGGYVYHGEAIEALAGKYIYGDFVTGRLWAVTYDDEGEARPLELIASTGLAISSFAQDVETGEVYVLDYDPRGANGGAGVYKLVAGEGASDAAPFPATLSQTGCFDASDPRRPAPGLIPYAPSAPFWSDGADKKRWIALPDGATIQRAGDRWEFPVGTVLVKEFSREGERIETRLFMRHDDGVWAGYTYAWREDQRDADLLRAGEVREVAGGPWKYPSRAECMGCHTPSAGFVLGFEAIQLGQPTVYPATNRRAAQLDTLDHIGLFEPALGDDRSDLPSLVDPFGDAPLAERARAYLHSNCAYCHVEDGVARGDLRLGAARSLAETNACDVAPQLDDLGIADARLIAPGEPDRSVLLERMRRTDAARMPDNAGLLQDREGARLIRSWIYDLERCP